MQVLTINTIIRCKTSHIWVHTRASELDHGDSLKPSPRRNERLRRRLKSITRKSHISHVVLEITGGVHTLEERFTALVFLSCKHTQDAMTTTLHLLSVGIILQQVIRSSFPLISPLISFRRSLAVCCLCDCCRWFVSIISIACQVSVACLCSYCSLTLYNVSYSLVSRLICYRWSSLFIRALMLLQ